MMRPASDTSRTIANPLPLPWNFPIKFPTTNDLFRFARPSYESGTPVREEDASSIWGFDNDLKTRVESLKG